MARNHVDPRVKVPGTNVGLLTAASKMPSASWSLPAVKSCPGAWFGENGICGTDRKDPKQHNCYARHGMYRFNTVQNAQDARYRWVLECLTSDAGTDVFVSTMVSAIRADGRPFFRVHDSGDMFNARYARAWVRICEALPEVRFWVPTRSYRLPAIVQAMADLAALPNVSVRPSALRIGDAAPSVPGLSAGTGVKSEGFTCPAYSQNNQCGDCRACWDKSEPVYYRLH